jgi:hypothetical protein
VISTIAPTVVGKRVASRDASAARTERLIIAKRQTFCQTGPISFIRYTTNGRPFSFVLQNASVEE